MRNVFFLRLKNWTTIFCAVFLSCWTDLFVLYNINRSQDDYFLKFTSLKQHFLKINKTKSLSMQIRPLARRKQHNIFFQVQDNLHHFVCDENRANWRFFCVNFINSRRRIRNIGIYCAKCRGSGRKNLVRIYYQELIPVTKNS